MRALSRCSPLCQRGSSLMSPGVSAHLLGANGSNPPLLCPLLLPLLLPLLSVTLPQEHIMSRAWLKAAALLWLVPGCLGAAARLYTEEDPLVILGSSSLKPAVTNSSSAWLLQFYSSWCGHCVQFSGSWKSLALDVKGSHSLTRLHWKHLDLMGSWSLKPGSSLTLWIVVVQELPDTSALEVSSLSLRSQRSVLSHLSCSEGAA